MRQFPIFRGGCVRSGVGRKQWRGRSHAPRSASVCEVGSSDGPELRRRRLPRPPVPPRGSSCQPPGVGAQGWAAGSAGVETVASGEAATRGGRGDEALPHPAPPRGGGGHGAAGLNPGQERGARPSRLPQLLPQLLLLPPPATAPRPRASS